MKRQDENTSAPGGYVYPTPLIMDNEKVGTSMRHSSPDNQVQQETIASEIAAETLQDVIYTRVDPYTLEIIQHIFPTPNKGLEFTARILRFAQIIQNVLPGLEDLGEHVAVINVPTIRLLAKWIDWGYDTTHKYITTFCALGLLRKNKQGNERQLIFPLERYILPTNLQPLDNLIAKSRPKVQQFARQVKTRLLQLNTATQPGSVNKFEESDVRFRETIYQSLFNLIESEGIDPATGRHLSKRIIAEVLSQFSIARATIQEHEKTCRQVATGTNNNVVSQLAIAQTAQPPYESTQYQTESTHYPTQSTQYQTKYAQYQTESTPKMPQGRLSDTRVSTQGRLRDTRVSTQGRLRDTRVSAQGRLASHESASSLSLGETQVDWGRFTTPKVSFQPLEEDTHPKRGRPEQPTASIYQETYTSPNKIGSQEILHCYESVLRDNLVDWEAEGLPAEFIERLYQELHTVYTTLSEKRLTGTSGFFFKTLEKRFINRFATEYQLDFTSVYNLIMFHTGREELMLEEQQQSVSTQATTPIEDYQQPANDRPTPTHRTKQYQIDYSNENYQNDNGKQTDRYSHEAEYQHSVDSHEAEYQHSVDSHEAEYQHPVDSHEAEYQHPVDSHETEYQYPVDPYEAEYQYPVDSHEAEYQYPVDPKSSESTGQQSAVDSHRKKYRQRVDSTARKSTSGVDPQNAGEDFGEQESTQRPVRANVSLTEIIEKSILDEGKTYLRIPQKLDAQKYSSDFLNVYVTSDINLLFNNIYNNTSLRNDAKMFFAEIFDANRSSTAKNWYNKLFSKCSNYESLLAGFIETILDLHSRGNKTIKNPGGLFNKKCAECEKTVSASTREHIDTYSHQPYEEFVLEIARFAQREHNNTR